MSHSRPWEDSIGLQEGSSGGQSLIRSIKPWSQRTSNVLKIGNDSYISFFSPSDPETTDEVTITLELEGETSPKRFLGCIMIGMMSDEGLEEALFSLRDMLVFYNQKPLHAITRLTPGTINGTIIERKKRPDLVIT